jgi:hypothetical protein
LFDSFSRYVGQWPRDISTVVSKSVYSMAEQPAFDDELLKVGAF